MEYTITGKSLDNLEEKLASYTALTAEKKELGVRLDKVESEKRSVDDHIYEKVKAEYSRKLEDACSRLEPLVSEIEDTRQESESRLPEVIEQIRLLEEELAEAEFRFRVGEFEKSKLVDIRSRLAPEIKENTDLKKELSEAIKSIEATVNNGEQPEETPVETAPIEPAGDDETPVVDDGPSPEETASATEEAAAEPEEAASETESLFENPQDWIDEIGPDKKKSTPEAAAPDAGSEQDNDPLSALADPSAENHNGAKKEPEKKPERPVAVEFPNLVIVSGPNAGRKIPVLPMTMSVGREHDNNIELKDPEIARYHARIVHEKGQFILEDLESTNGTWLNGERIKQTALKNGDRIKIGETEIVLDFD